MRDLEPEPEPQLIESELEHDPEPEPEPQLEPAPEPAAQSRWIKPLSCYERKKTTIVEGLRYG